MIYLGADHAGWKTKEYFKKYLKRKDLGFKDFSSPVYNSKDDYPIIAEKVAKKVARDKESLGILICDSGTGMAVAANKVKGIRAALVFNNWMARHAKADDHANVLVFGEALQRPDQAVRMYQAFMLVRNSSASRHLRRLKQILKLK